MSTAHSFTRRDISFASGQDCDHQLLGHARQLET